MSCIYCLTLQILDLLHVALHVTKAALRSTMPNYVYAISCAFTEAFVPGTPLKGLEKLTKKLTKLVFKVRFSGQP